MKKTLLLASLLFGAYFSNAQTVLFEDSFETYPDFVISGYGDWLTLDLDGSTTYSGGGGIAWANINQAQAFMVFNPTAAGVTNAVSGSELRNFDPRTGNKYVGCWASVTPPNNDWLVSPPITLGAEGNNLKFYVKSLSSTYGLETYRVGIYTGSGNPTNGSNFTIISGGSDLIAPYNVWEEKTFNLDAYAGQTVRVGIHCNSNDRYFFMVDDFSVTTTGASIIDHNKNVISVYPNPAKDIINISSSREDAIDSVKITDINGRVVKTTENLSSINISDLNSGVYFVTVKSNETIHTSKIVKQ